MQQKTRLLDQLVSSHDQFLSHWHGSEPGTVGCFDKRHHVTNEVQTVDSDLFVMLPAVCRRYVGDEIRGVRDAHAKKPNEYLFPLNFQFYKYARNAIRDALMHCYVLIYSPEARVKRFDARYEFSEDGLKWWIGIGNMIFNRNRGSSPLR